MSMYFSYDDLTTRISNSELTQFLDDQGNGQQTPGLLNLIISAASNAADALVASIYPTPFSPVPDKIKEASIVFGLEMLYQRRLVPSEKNQFKEQADIWRKLLMDIGSGKLPLDESFARGFPPVVANTYKSVLSFNRFDGQPVSMM